MDALVYVKEHVDEFNVIVVDSTDPVDFAAGLYERSFFVTAASALKGDGMIVAQTESPFAEPEIVSSTFSALSEAFPISFLYWGAVPTYPTGLWTYAIGSKLYDPRETRSPAPLDVRYYTKELHRSAFILPKFLKDLIGGDAQVQTKQKACRAT
ncbi:MAG TPA: spermidine synthase, partial [Thermosynergistes sp.]|nr:spermidine synthase [Thermosynergistes sp.]